MSRKFNTKKFIKDVLNDKYALVIGNEIILDTKIKPTNLQRTAIQSVAEVLLWPSFDAAKEMAGSSHTPASCWSKLRSSLEAGKKQPRVWLQYVCGVTEMFLDEPSGRAERLYLSLGVGFHPTFLTLGRANAFVLHSLNRKVPSILLWSPFSDSEMARNGVGNGSKLYVSNSVELS